MIAKQIHPAVDGNCRQPGHSFVSRITHRLELSGSCTGLSRPVLYCLKAVAIENKHRLARVCVNGRIEVLDCSCKCSVTASLSY